MTTLEEELSNKSNSNSNVQSEDDEDEDEDPDFDPTSSTNTPQENVSEDDSDDGEDGDCGESEKDLEENNTKPFGVRPVSRKRASTTSLEEVEGGSRRAKEPKLVSVNSNQEMKLPPGIPRTRITFLSGKASDIGLGGLAKKGTGGGLSGVLAALHSKKQTTMSTLEKSRLDWQAFKQAEGIEDEMNSQLKSRHGFLDKRDFLERTDFRQFEREKNMRAKQRRTLGSS